MRLPFNNLGSLGFLGDVLPHELPPEAWSGGINARFVDGYARKIRGHTAAYGTPTVAPYWLLPVPTPVAYRWLYASLTKVYTVDSGRTHTDITRTAGGDYTANVDVNWNGGLINGIPVINNGSDVPQMWNPVGVGTPLAALTAWPGTWKARCIRPYRGFLFAMDTEETGVRYPHKVRWSHGALPGAVPSTWDESDTTKDAGQVTLADTGGYVLDSVPLRNTNVVYKEDQVWGFQYVAGGKIFEPQRILSEIGAMSRDCAVPFFHRGIKHVVFGADDLYVHDGNSAESIANRRVRRWLFSQIDGSNYQRCFTVADYENSEVWFCFPSTGSTLCNYALPWSWLTQTFGVPRELPQTRFIASGLIADSGVDESWNADAASWDSDAAVWDERLFGSAVRRMLMGVPGGPSLQQVNVGNTANGTVMTTRLERTGLAFASQARDGSLKADLKVRKLVREVWPRMEGPNGAVVKISVGVQDHEDGGTTWIGPFNFRIGVDRKISPMAAGRFIGVRFESDTDIEWKLHAYELELDAVGVY